MAKKLLCVLLSVLMVVSLLPMGVVADETVVSTQTSTGTLSILSGADFTDSDLYLYINFTLDDSDYSYYGPGSLCDSGWANVIYLDSYSACSGTYVISLVDLAAEFEAAGYDASNCVVLNWWGSSYATFVSAELVDTSAGADNCETSIAMTLDSVGGYYSNDNADVDVTATSDGLNSSSLQFELSLPCEVDSGVTVTVHITGTSDSDFRVWLSEWGSTASNIMTVSSGAFDITFDLTMSGTDIAAGDALTTANFILFKGITSSTNLDNLTLTHVGITYPDGYVSSKTSSTNYSGYRFIYVDETYHALIINGHFICSEHDVDSNGYCTVCKEYIGLDGEEATTTINGGEYVEAYSCDVNLVSSGWGTYEFSDNSIIDALATEGAILVITRSKETDIVYGDSTYEKFGIVDYWWTGDWIRLGTGGNTDADEVDDTIIDCISDDGTVVIYDGATVYEAWASAGMNNGGVATLITNTSGAYTITNVTVYVPAGTVVEDVEVEQPAEDTNSGDEEDGEDIDVGDDAEEVESNPTTGAVLALVPMAIAGFAVVSSKRR